MEDGILSSSHFLGPNRPGKAEGPGGCGKMLFRPKSLTLASGTKAGPAVSSDWWVMGGEYVSELFRRYYVPLLKANHINENVFSRAIRGTNHVIT
jgi:hypothetical protein